MPMKRLRRAALALLLLGALSAGGWGGVPDPVMLDTVITSEVPSDLLPFYVGASLTGDLPAGIFQLRSALSRTPDAFATRLLLASLMTQAGWMEDAQTELRRAAADDRTGRATRYREQVEGDVSLGEGRWADALRHFGAATPRSANPLLPYARAACAYASLWASGPRAARALLGDTDEGPEADLRTALDLIEGRREAAAAQARRVVQAALHVRSPQDAARPQNSVLWIQSVLAARSLTAYLPVLRATGHADEADAALAQAVMLFPESPAMRLQELNRKPDLASAVWTFQTCTPVNVHYTVWRALHAGREIPRRPLPPLPPLGPADAAACGPLPDDAREAYVKEHGGGRFALLRGHLRQMVQARRDPEVLVVLAGALVLAGEEASAAQSLDTAEQMAPSAEGRPYRSLLLRFRADLRARHADLDGALALYAEALLAARNDIDRTLALEGRGMASLWKGDLDTAAEAFVAALACAPAAYQPMLLKELGFTAWVRGQAEDAERCFLQALRLYPSDRQGFSLLVGFYTQTRQVDKCRTALRQALLGQRPSQTPQASWVDIFVQLMPPEKCRPIAARCFRNAMQPQSLATVYRTLQEGGGLRRSGPNSSSRREGPAAALSP